MPLGQEGPLTVNTTDIEHDSKYFTVKKLYSINWGKVKKNQGNLIIGLEIASILMTRGRKRPRIHRVNMRHLQSTSSDKGLKWIS